jgi:hypothetical protein
VGNLDWGRALKKNKHKKQKSASTAEGDSAKWIYERILPMGGAAGEAYTNTLAASGMPPASVLAREAIQNSVDARQFPASKVIVEFVFKNLEGDDKKKFVAASGLKSFVPRAKDLGFKEPNCIANLGDASAPIRLLFVNDFNTTGLEGDPDSPSSKFNKFLLSLGDGGKEDEHGTGGSYGFGKSVYSSNSGILAIFAYSRTRDEKKKPISLFFGCGYFRKHKHDDQYYTGRAWFGVDRTPKYAHAQQLVKPLLDSDADKMAAVLGFDTRDESQLGTSVLIVDTALDAAGILRGVEDWWWPRIISHRLDVQVIDEAGKKQLPRPLKRDDLRPFVEAFNIAMNKSPTDEKAAFRRQFNKLDKTNIGVVGLRVLERNEKDEYSVEEDRIDSVALIRMPLMVVKYYRQWMVGSPAMAGAFVADEAIDDVLKSAEPPAHDAWDRDARRLSDQSGQKRIIVDRVLRSIKSNLKAIQAKASPPPPPRPKRLSFLERTLASFFAGSKKSVGNGANANPAPIHLSYDQEPQPEVVGKKLRLSAKFTVRLKADEDLEKLPARVRITCPVVEDGQIGESLVVNFKASEAIADDQNKPGWHTFTLTKKKAIRFDCTTEPYDPMWTVKFVPEIEPAEVSNG